MPISTRSARRVIASAASPRTQNAVPRKLDLDPADNTVKNHSAAPLSRPVRLVKGNLVVRKRSSPRRSSSPGTPRSSRSSRTSLCTPGSLPSPAQPAPRRAALHRCTQERPLRTVAHGATPPGSASPLAPAPAHFTVSPTSSYPIEFERRDCSSPNTAPRAAPPHAHTLYRTLEPDLPGISPARSPISPEGFRDQISPVPPPGQVNIHGPPHSPQLRDLAIRLCHSRGDSIKFSELDGDDGYTYEICCIQRPTNRSDPPPIVVPSRTVPCPLVRVSLRKPNGETAFAESDMSIHSMYSNTVAEFLEFIRESGETDLAPLSLSTLSPVCNADNLTERVQYTYRGAAALREETAKIEAIRRPHTAKYTPAASPPPHPGQSPVIPADIADIAAGPHHHLSDTASDSLPPPSPAADSGVKTHFYDGEPPEPSALQRTERQRDREWLLQSQDPSKAVYYYSSPGYFSIRKLRRIRWEIANRPKTSAPRCRRRHTLPVKSATPPPRNPPAAIAPHPPRASAASTLQTRQQPAGSPCMRDRAAGAAPELHDSTDADPVTSPAAPCASPYTRDSTPESHRYPASGVPEHEPHPGSDAVHMSPSFIQRSVARYLKSNVVPTLEELVAFHRDGVINVDASCLKLDMDSAEREYLEYERTLRRELEKEERNIDSKSRAVLLNVKTSSIRISNLTETIEVYSLKKKRRLERLTSEKELCFPSQMRIGMIELDIEVLGTDIRQFEERRDALIKSLREQEAEYQTLLDSLIQFRIQRKLKEAELDGVRDKELYLRKVLLFLQAAGADVDIGPDGRVAIHGLDAIGKTAPRSAESPPNVPHPLPLAESGMHPSPRSPGRSRHSPTRANLAKRSDAGPDIHQERSAARSPALYPDILVSPAWTSKRDKDPTSRSHANSPSLYESSGESRATPPSSPDRTRPPVRGHVAWTAPIDARIDAEVDTEFDTKVDTGVRSSGRKGNESHNMFWGSLSAPPSLEPVNRSAHDVSCSARCGGTAAPVYFREGHPFSESPLSSPNVSGTPAALARVGPNKPGASHSGAEFVFGHSEDFENRLVSPAATAGLLTGGSSRRPATHEYELESGSVSSNEDRFVDCESYRSSSPIARNAPEASAVHTQPARCAHYESEEQEQFPNDRENRPDSPIIGTESQVTMSPSRAGRAAGSLYTESASEIAPAHPFPEPAREHAIANHNLALYNEAVASVREEREALMQRLRDDFCMRASGPTIASVVGIRAKIPPPVRKSVIFRRLKELQEEKIRARARIDQVEQSPPPATSDPPSGGCSRAPLKMPRRMPSFFKRVSGAASSPREAEVEVKVEAEAKVKAEAKMERSAEMEPTQPSRKRACHASSMIPVPAGARDYYAQLCKRQRRNESEAAAASEAAGGSNPHLPRKVALDRRAALGPPLRRRSARLMEKAMASARPDTGSARHSGAESAEVQPPSPSRISPAACATGTRSRGKRITQRASARPVASRRVRPRGMQIVGKVSTRPEMKPHPPASQRLPSRKGQKKGRSQKAATGKASRIKGAVRTSVQAASSSRGSRPRSRTRRSKGSIVPVGSRTSVGRLPVARRTSSLESAEYADISTAQSPAADESAAEGQSPSHRARESPYAVGTDIDFGAELESSKPDMNEGSMERILSSVCADRPIDDEYGDPIVPGGAGGADSTGTVADHADNFGEYFEDVIDLLFETETDYTPSIKNLEGCLGSRDHRIRGYLVDWMLDIYTRLKLRPESFYLSVNMVDRCLALGKYTPDQYQLTAIACLFIAAKYESSSVPAIKFFVAVTGGKCTARDIIQAEAEILQILDYKLNAPNPMYMLRLCLKAYAGIPDMRSLSRYLLDLCTLSSSFQGIVPSAIAATSVNLAKIILFPDDWDTKFEFDQLRKYDYEKLSPYMEILIGILRERKLHGNFMRKYAVGRYAAINEKVEDFLNECISVM